MKGEKELTTPLAVRGAQGQALLPNGTFTVTEEGVSGAAAEKLLRLEEACIRLQQEQERLSGELTELRLAGKEKSYQFRERMGRKLVNSQVLSLLRAEGLC